MVRLSLHKVLRILAGTCHLLIVISLVSVGLWHEWSSLMSSKGLAVNFSSSSCRQMAHMVFLDSAHTSLLVNLFHLLQ